MQNDSCLNHISDCCGQWFDISEEQTGSYLWVGHRKTEKISILLFLLRPDCSCPTSIIVH